MNFKSILTCFLLVLPLTISSRTEGQTLVDSLKQLLPNSIDSVRINILNKLGEELAYSDGKTALQYLNESLQLSKKLDYKKGLADAYLYLNYASHNRAEFSDALEYAKNANDIYAIMHDEYGMARTLSSLGVIYASLGQYDKSLDYNIKSLNKYEKIKNEKGMSNCYQNIADIYAKQKRYDMSLFFQRKALAIDLKNNSNYNIISSYHNIANIYLGIGQYEKALSYLDSIMPALKKENNIYVYAKVYSLFACIYIKTGDIKKAIEFYKISNRYAEKGDNIVQMVENLTNLSEVYIQEGNIYLALVSSEKAYSLAKKVNRLFVYSYVYDNLAKVYKIKGNYELSIEYLNKYIEVNDSLRKKELSDKVLSLQTLYETKLKEEQINSLNKDNEIKNTRLARQKIFIGATVLTLLLVIVLVIVLLNRSRLKRKANELLQQKNLEIEKQKQEILTINEQLSSKAEELKELDQVKSRFFTNISHEFRTPLTLIIGPLEVLMLHTTDENVKADYKIMLRQAKRLLTLVNQLLELSKLEKGAMRLTLTKDDFNGFIRTITESYTSLASELKIDLTFNGYDGELNIWFDQDKVEKIITNLITNAFKFTNAGGKIEVILRNGLGNEQFMEIVIRDTGSGIETEHLKHIFDPFYQVVTTTNKRFQGTGIGLALVKEFIHLHHGTISVKSKPGSGSEFIVQFPTRKSIYNIDEFVEAEKEFEAVSPDISIKTTFESSLKEKSKRVAKEKTIILIVEDNEDMRKYISQNLPDEFQLVEAVNGKDGIEKAKEIVPDLIITDIMMPYMDGLEMVRILKKDERTSHVPVIILTAKASEESKIEGLETHVDDYITKPFSIRELILRIQNLIANRQKLREKFEKSISILPSEIASNSVDEKFLQRALQIIENNIDSSEYNTEKFCEDIGMSRSTLHRKLIALTNQSTTEFIRTIRLKRAAQLLLKKTTSVSEIAYQTGFSNLSYFTKCFKDQFGKTPSEYCRKGKIIQ